MVLKYPPPTPERQENTDAVSASGKRRYYHRWSALKRRCYNPKTKDSRYYGGRGVTMHAPWVQSYEAFYNWLEENLGPCPAKHVLKRHNLDGHFEPGNVYWGSHTAQGRGRRSVVLSLDAARVVRAMRTEGQPVEDIAQAVGVSQDLVGQVLAGSIWKEAA
jgi:hypothetical protein